MVVNNPNGRKSTGSLAPVQPSGKSYPSVSSIDNLTLSQCPCRWWNCLLEELLLMQYWRRGRLFQTIWSEVQEECSEEVRCHFYLFGNRCNSLWSGSFTGLCFFHIYTETLYSKTGGQMLELCSDNGTNIVGAIGQWNQLWIVHHNDTYFRKESCELLIPPSWLISWRTLGDVHKIWEKGPQLHLECAKSELNPLLTVDWLPTCLWILITWENYSEPLISVGDEDEEDVFACFLWKQVQHMTDLFCKRWVKEYLTKLQDYTWKYLAYFGWGWMVSTSAQLVQYKWQHYRYFHCFISFTSYSVKD